MSGFISISRKIFDNPLLKDAEYFRAWVWLISEAAWKPTRERIQAGHATILINLERGQLAHSRRFITKALDWTEQRVRTFLNHLENEGMINRQTNQGQTVITICKYDDYQIGVDADNQASNPPTNPASTQHQPKLNKGNKGNNIDSGAGARPIRFPKKPSTPMPEDFSLDAANERAAAEKGFAGEEVRRMFEKFSDHHRAKGSRFVDWRAAWRTWIGNQVEFQRQRFPQGQRRVPDV